MKIHKLYTGIYMGTRWYRSACGRWNDLKMTGFCEKGWKGITCKNCLKTKKKKD